MSLSLRGELTEQAATSFSHPNSLLPPKLSRLTALAYAIMKGDQKSISSVLKESNEFLLNEFDYSGNTPLVSTVFFVTPSLSSLPFLSPSPFLMPSPHPMPSLDATHVFSPKCFFATTFSRSMSSLLPIRSIIPYLYLCCHPVSRAFHLGRIPLPLYAQPCIPLYSSLSF